MNIKAPIRFEYVFEDEGDRKISFEYSPSYDEQLRTNAENGSLILSVNKSACISLAKLLIKLALGRYPNGYRVCIRRDFDGNNDTDDLVLELAG